MGRSVDYGRYCTEASVMRDLPKCTFLCTCCQCSNARRPVATKTKAPAGQKLTPDILEQGLVQETRTGYLVSKLGPMGNCCAAALAREVEPEAHDEAFHDLLAALALVRETRSCKFQGGLVAPLPCPRRAGPSITRVPNASHLRATIVRVTRFG